MTQGNRGFSRAGIPVLLLGMVCILMNLSACQVPAREQPTSSLPTLTAATTLFPTATSSPTALGSETPLPESSPTAMPTSTPLPAEMYITGIQGHKQYFPLGCEAAAAVDWAGYFGVAINEYEFQTSLPQSDNPELGYVGGLMGPWGQTPPYSYGVHAAPVAELLRQYGLNALAVKGYTVEEIRQQIAQGKPVIAWVIGNCVGGVPAEYTDSQGNTVIVAAYEHVIIITGYNESHIRYLNNAKYYDVPVEVFENSWSVLGNMAIILQ